MKRISAFLLLCGILMGLSACDLKGQDYKHAVEFYYLRQEDAIDMGSADGVIASETREAGYGNDLRHILTLYFQGPADNTLVSPFPEDVHLISFRLEQGALELTLSNEFSSLDGIDLTTACACVAKTCLALENVDSVKIHISDVHLDIDKTVIITEDTLHFLDETDMDSANEEE